MNERITENIVRDYLRDLNYYLDSTDAIVEEQKSQIIEVQRLLKNASKTGKGGHGSPEFIISSHMFPDIIIVIECKSDIKYHESENLDRIDKFAVDGVLHYAKFLAKSYTVIAIAISGQRKSALKISTYLLPKHSTEAKILTNEYGKPVEQIVSIEEYIRLSSYDPEVAKKRHTDLMAFSRELHEFMRDHAKLTESEKPLLVSGTLIALKNEIFAKTFDMHSPDKLQTEWMRIIKEEINKADIPNSKKNNMTQPYSSIAVHPELGKSSTKYPKGPLNELIRLLNEKVWPFISIYHDFDVVGQFYGEFLKYTGGDKKALGIVLTPRHITELFSHIANLSIYTTSDGEIKSDKVLDICTGTGGFLISSMQHLIKNTTTEHERNYIKEHCLVGVEQQPSMYALAASNMILRGDGKANLYQGSCFDDAIIQAIRSHECTVGMINPPYSQNDEELHELVFIKRMLDCLSEGGIGIAIVPMTCAISPHPMREEILKHHTLEAVMSMPDELFYPVGTVTCIMVFKAGIPHGVSNKKSWFGYWKNDGFIKTKHLGRLDANDSWNETLVKWIEQFKNRDSIPGESVTAYVTHEDEWCAEAFMETDYSTVSVEDFKNVLKNYALFHLSRKETTTTEYKEWGKIRSAEWEKYKIGDLFDIRKGRRLTKSNMIPGTVPFIGSIDSNNGVSGFVGQEPIHDGNTITVNYNGSVAEAFYQPVPFWASDDVNVLYPRFEMNEFIALYIVSIIKKEKFRFNYGRKWHVERMMNSTISLPINSKGDIDFNMIEEFMKELPFSDKLL